MNEDQVKDRIKVTESKVEKSFGKTQASYGLKKGPQKAH